MYVFLCFCVPLFAPTSPCFNLLMEYWFQATDYTKFHAEFTAKRVSASFSIFPAVCPNISLVASKHFPQIQNKALGQASPQLYFCFLSPTPFSALSQNWETRLSASYLSIYPSVRLQELRSKCTDFDETWYSYFSRELNMFVYVRIYDSHLSYRLQYRRLLLVLEV
jgi:hypothetical protein